MTSNVIIVCPCCASALDATTDAEHDQTFECISCGQRWTMRVDAARHQDHALY